ncbi:olfactory receptor 6N2-like [Nematolebias whitei]|uniref:olfactory receptor 6N2-like n=1 Tax=Nematolebias whitei TaxID=451745 RepID=UPI001897DE10|nr:olfactory receptor 6N2-like [Nematolebias whitei]
MMDIKFNITYITLDGYIQVHKYRFLYFVIMFTVYILILCCNFIVVSLIVTQKSLHEPMYVFIAALLLNSVLFSTVVYPKLLIDILSERQIISYSSCFLQHFLYYSLGSSEFLLLTAMAYDRYVSICKPLQYPTIMERRTISILLVFAWITPAFHLFVSLLAVRMLNENPCSYSLNGIFCNSPLYHLLCVRLEALVILDMMTLVNVALLPLLCILFSYIRILIISYRSSTEVKKKASRTCIPHLLVLISFSCFGAYDVITVVVESDISKIVHLAVTLQMVVFQPLFNPIIYGLKMKEIYKHLKRLAGL